jgi:serine/threonine-protein kinase
MLQGEFGKYRIENVIGMGGMSIVYRAFDETLQRDTALKILNVRRMSNPIDVRRFKREVEIAQRLRHPNIIDIYEYGEVENFAYLAMEYMPGGSLAERYSNPVHLTLGESSEMLKVIASALDFAHAEGVLHRDLKLSNILIAEDGRLTLSDFGLALMQDESRITRTGQTFGTPTYMSPEQVNGSRGIDYRADVYSFAVIAYLMATGYFPFMTTNTLTILNQHLSERAPLPSRLNPRLPQVLDDVLLKGLSKKRDERQTSAGALAREFEAAVAGIEDMEVVLLTSQPTPIIESSSHYPFPQPVKQNGEITSPVNDWRGIITPDLGDLEDYRETGALVRVAAEPVPVPVVEAKPEVIVAEVPRISRWAVTSTLVVGAFAVLMALGAILPITGMSSSAEGLNVQGTRPPTATLTPATFSPVLNNDATPTLPLFVGLSTAVAGNANGMAHNNTLLDNDSAGMIEFVEPTATQTVAPTLTELPPSATRTFAPTATDELSIALLASTQARSTQRAEQTAAAAERQVTPSRTPAPLQATPTATPTWHEVYVMVTAPPTTASRSARNGRANSSEPTAAPQSVQQSGGGQPAPQPTSVPATQAPQPTSAPATAAPQSGLVGSLLNPLLAPVESLLPVVPTLVNALP